jgi:hypothetical protein
MATILTIEEKLKKNAEVLIHGIDLSPIVKMKNALNEVFGEERNQIVSLFEKESYLKFSQVKDFSGDVKNYKKYVIDNYFFDIIIHFPEITIKNSKGKSRKIYDLYVKFNVGLDFKIKENLMGIATTFEEDALNSSYHHSHLPSGKYTDFKSFCLGSDTPINLLFHKMKSNAFDEGTFKMLLYTIREYVSWESLEGGPHVRMSNVNVNNVGAGFNWLTASYTTENLLSADSILNFPSKAFSEISLCYILKEAITEDARNIIINNCFTYRLEGTEVILQPTDFLSKKIAMFWLELWNVLKINYRTSTRSYKEDKVRVYLAEKASFNYTARGSFQVYHFCNDLAYRTLFKKNDQGKFIIDAKLYEETTGSTFPISTNTSIYTNGKKLFKFKGNDVTIRIIIPEDKTKVQLTKEELETFYIHPKILNYVTNYFADKLNSQIITTCTGTREDTTNNFAEAPTTDILALLQD